MLIQCEIHVSSRGCQLAGCHDVMEILEQKRSRQSMGLAVDLERSRGLPMRDGEHRDRSLHWPHTNASIAAEWTRGRDVDPVAHQFIHLMRFSFQVQQKSQRHA